SGQLTPVTPSRWYESVRVRSIPFSTPAASNTVRVNHPGATNPRTSTTAAPRTTTASAPNTHGSAERFFFGGTVNSSAPFSRAPCGACGGATEEPMAGTTAPGGRNWGCPHCGGASGGWEGPAITTSGRSIGEPRCGRPDHTTAGPLFASAGPSRHSGGHHPAAERGHRLRRGRPHRLGGSHDLADLGQEVDDLPA